MPMTMRTSCPAPAAAIPPGAAWRNCAGTNRIAAYGLGADGSGGKATISSCFYLLVKYAEVTPKSFICKGDSGTTEFKLSELSGTAGVTAATELIDAVGLRSMPPTAYKSCSYSYHVPFGSYALTVSSEPGFAVAADRNPWLKSPAGEAGTFNLFKPDLTGYTGGTTETAKAGNAVSHQSEGQNVMFLDTHVDFEKRAYCSLEDDNIYTISNIAGSGHAAGHRSDERRRISRSTARTPSWFMILTPSVAPVARPGGNKVFLI